VSATHADVVLFLAGVLLAIGAGAAVFVLAPVLGVGRLTAGRPATPALRLPRRPRPRAGWSPARPRLPNLRYALPVLHVPRVHVAVRPLDALRALAWRRPELLWGTLAVVVALLAAVLLVPKL
jgi:hypothetical protein